MAEASSTVEVTGPQLNPSFLLSNPANLINSVKLRDNNYLLWQLRVLAGIRGLGLELYYTKTSLPAPYMIFRDDHRTKLLNPQFIAWARQDQLHFSFY